MKSKEKLFEEIARGQLAIPTLKRQNSDSRDFWEVAVWGVSNAFERVWQEAYKRGVQKGKTKRLKTHEQFENADRKYWHGVIRNRLKQYRKECLNCLYGEDRTLYYTWNNVNRTVALMNNILEDVPEVAWPKCKKDDNSWWYPVVKVASNNWCMELLWEEDKYDVVCRHANLKFKNDDHTAWVIEHPKKKGTFIDYDIGGS
jgi:hypothetical protein